MAAASSPPISPLPSVSPSFAPVDSPSALSSADPPSSNSTPSFTSSPPLQSPPLATPSPVTSVLASPQSSPPPPSAPLSSPPPPPNAPLSSPPPPPLPSSPAPSPPTTEAPPPASLSSPPPSSLTPPPPPSSSSPPLPSNAPPPSGTAPLNSPQSAPSSSIPPTSPPPPSSPSPQAVTSLNSSSIPSGTSPPPSGSQPSSPPSTTPLLGPVSHISTSPSPSVSSSPSQGSIQGSSNTTGSNSRPSPSPNAESSSKGGVSTNAAVAIGIVAGFIVFGLIVFAVWCQRKGRKRLPRFDDGVDVGSSPRSDPILIIKTESQDPIIGSGSGNGNFSPSDHGGLGNSRSWFTYQELFDATNGFSSQNFLGEGGFGSVYKGILEDGREVAVKQHKTRGGQEDRELKAEVEIISRIHHRHLVSLVGYCISESCRLLVYDYVANNTLYHHLHGEGEPVLDWTRRFKIASGAARGIRYLHEYCHPQIIHRDIKSSNILLDNNFKAQVSDFGLAKLKLDADTHVSTRVMGTYGYMAPEYATSGKLTEKSDVYSFGVVLLELVTGRSPIDASHTDEGLVEWARPWLNNALETGEVQGLVDPRLGRNYIESEVFCMIEAAAACVRHSSAKRPQMGQIVRAFDSIATTSDLNNGMKVGESQVCDSTQQSAEIRWLRRMAFGNPDNSTDFFSEPEQRIEGLSQGSKSGHSSTPEREAGRSRYQSLDATAVSMHESQNLFYSCQERQNVCHLSMDSAFLSRQESQNASYSSQSRQESQELYYSCQLQPQPERV